jgi:class 3 adenylate cyclase
MAQLSAQERANLPDRAFAYIDSKGGRRLPIHDESHVRNALARFARVKFEDDAAREKARRRLLAAAKRYGIVPLGFIDGQFQSERRSRTDYSALPRGAVTFLMTDIERSTALLRDLEGDYAGLLRDVRTLIRNAVRACGGHQVDAHADEVLAVFTRPDPAIEAAIEVQRRLRAEVWSSSKVRVRAGIHSGRPTLTDSGYVGLAVHTVARVCFVGHGGQIVVSRATRSAVEGSLPPGVRLRSLGRHRLAGLPLETLYQVEAKGLSTRFPALRTSTLVSKP